MSAADKNGAIGAANSFTRAQLAALPAVRRIATTRNGIQGGVNATNKTDGSVASATYRTWLEVGPSDTTDIVVSYANWLWNSTGEVVGDNTITVKAALEYNSKFYPLYSRGARTVTIESGATISFDASGIRLPAGAQAWVRTYVTNNSVVSGTWPLGRASATNGNESDNFTTATGLDLTDAIGSFTGRSGYQFGPVSVTGRQRSNGIAVGILGDSIGSGAGDTNAAVIGYAGFLERGLMKTVPWVSLTRAGFRGVYIASDQSRSSGIIGREVGGANITTLICQLGVNDIFAQNSTLAQLQANFIAIWTNFYTRGVRVYQTTITPDTTSTDGFTSTANQTLVSSGQETVRENFNDWLRAGAPMSAGAAVAVGTAGAILAGSASHPLTNYIEIADVAESARNSGKWAVNANARTLTDVVTTSGSATVTSATANFTDADIGTQAYLTAAGAASANLSATIIARASATSITLGTNASTSQAATTMKMGGNTADGLHPGLPIHTAAAAVIAAGIANGTIR